MRKPFSIVFITLVLLCLFGCTRQTGWLIRDGKTFYYSEDGTPVTGWQQIDGSSRFFGQDGAMVTGWLTHGGNTYYLLEDGTPLTGWLSMDSRRYYFTTDGSMAQGWRTIGNVRYYFDTDGIMATGKLELEDGVYLLDDNGVPLSGWQTLDGQPRYFRADGAMARGWEEIDGKRFCFSEDGSLLTGKHTLEDGTYLLQEDGSAYTGWLEEDGVKYYYQENGAMAVGKLQIGEETFFFSPHGVQTILVNPWNYLPEDYSVKLVTVEDYPVAEVCSSALRKMIADCRAAGFQPVVCSAYRTQKDQEYLYANKVQRVMAQGYEEEEARRLAATEVAIPGTSEHQLGLAIDIIDQNNWMLDESQAAMPTQKWLMEHCWEYGFILRFPVDATEITGIIYEPWHYRYVGVEMALELRDLGITLEEYLGAAQHE